MFINLAAYHGGVRTRLRLNKVKVSGTQFWDIYITFQQGPTIVESI